MREPSDIDDHEVIPGLWLGSNRRRIYKGEYEAVLTLGPADAVVVESGVIHKHSVESPDFVGQAQLANWVEKHWFEGRKTLVRAEPLLNGSRVVSRILLNLGSTEKEALTLLVPVHTHVRGAS